MSIKNGSKDKIEKRMTNGFLKVILIASVSAVVGIITMFVVAGQYEKALHDYAFPQGDIALAMNSLAEMRACLRGAIGYDDEAEIKQLVDEYKTYKADFEHYLAEIEKTATLTPEGQESYNLIINSKANFYSVSDSIMTEGAVTDREACVAAQHRMFNEYRPLYNDIDNALKHLMELNVEHGDDTVTFLKIFEFIMAAIILATIGISILAGSRIGKWIAAGIVKPITALSERLATFAKGDLDSPFPQNDKDDEVAFMIGEMETVAENLSMIVKDVEGLTNEIANGDFTVDSKIEDKYVGQFKGILAAIRRMNAQMRETLQQVEDASKQVAAGANNLAQSSQELAEGASEQAGAVQELTATIATITHDVEGAAAGLEESYNKAEAYAGKADHSRVQMEAMVSAMNRINETSEKIQNIIGELEDIAEQTNLLSLNASIEAARAGDAGRGFAVVADQIRKLAEQSSESAISSRELIEGSIQEVHEGNRAAEIAFEALDEVVKGVKDIATSSKTFSELAREQARSMQQAEIGVNQISDVVQGNSAVAEESSATSEELSAQADSLSNLVSRFVLGNE